jgi:hypothetical protein
MTENSNRSSHRLVIKTSTWNKDSMGLYDFNSKRMKKCALVVSESAKVVTNEVEVLAVGQKDSLKYPIHLLSVERKGPSYFVMPARSDKISVVCEKLWLVVSKAKKLNEYRLSEGDVVRLGRVKLRVRELSASLKTPNHIAAETLLSNQLHLGGLNSLNKQRPLDQHRVMGVSGLADAPCRVCYSELSTVDNPLVSICKCDGSLKYIHLHCLQTWISTKARVSRNPSYLSYEWQGLACEICKAAYPQAVQHKDEVFTLISVPKFGSKFIIFEEVNRSSGGLTYHYVNLEEGSVSIGRSHGAQMRVEDISVSRAHARLKVRNDGVFISDTDSKFGTLVQVTKPVAITSNSELTLKAGKTLFALSLKKQWRFLSCFGSCTRSSINRHEQDLNQD